MRTFKQFVSTHRPLSAVMCGISRAGKLSEAISDEKFKNQSWMKGQDALLHHLDVHSAFHFVHPHEDASLGKYSYDSFPVNDLLHRLHKGAGTTPADSEHIGRVEQMDNLMANSPATSRDVHVFTGVAHDIPKIFADHADEHGNVPEHITVHHPAFLSTSSDFKVASSFAAKHQPPSNFREQHTPRTVDTTKGLDNQQMAHVLQLHVPKGTKALTTVNEKNVRDAFEYEAVLHRGHKIKIHRSPSLVQGRAVWHAEVVGHDATPADDLWKKLRESQHS